MSNIDPLSPELSAHRATMGDISSPCYKFEPVMNKEIALDAALLLMKSGQRRDPLPEGI